MKYNLEDLTPKALKKRLLYGILAIVACYAMLLGIMYSITSAEEKVRNIVMICFGCAFAASLIGFISFTCISYSVKKKKLNSLESKKRVLDEEEKDDWQ